MWIFSTHGFLSIVQHKDLPDYFQVKSRTPAPLEELWPEHPIKVIEWADYRYRITILKTEVLQVFNDTMAEIDYTSFKDRCLMVQRNGMHDYHDVLVKAWKIMYEYQALME